MPISQTRGSFQYHCFTGKNVMHSCVYPRYTLTEKMLLGSVRLFSKSIEWFAKKCFDKIQKFEEAFFDWDLDNQ